MHTHTHYNIKTYRHIHPYKVKHIHTYTHTYIHRYTHTQIHAYTYRLYTHKENIHAYITDSDIQMQTQSHINNTKKNHTYTNTLKITTHNTHLHTCTYKHTQIHT